MTNQTESTKRDDDRMVIMDDMRVQRLDLKLGI